MSLTARAWAATLALVVLLLPWYGQEKLWTSLLAGDALPLAAAAWPRPWLLPLLAAPVVALLAAWRDMPRLLVAASLFGLAWLCLEGFAITHKGWAWTWLGSLLGGTPTQPALGWGALAYAFACTMLAAAGL